MDRSKEPTTEEAAVGKDFASAILMYHAALAARLGLGATDHKALDLVVRHGPVAAGWLAERTGLTTGAVTGIVDRLERAGFARRVRDEKDRRVVRIVVVPERRAEIDALAGPMREAMAAMAGEFSTFEWDGIRRYLERVTQVMVAETARLQSSIRPD